MKLMVENRFALLGLVMIALTALFGVATVTRPAEVGDTGAAGTRADVESAVRACPPPQGGDRASEIAAFAPMGGRANGALTAESPAEPPKDADDEDRAEAPSPAAAPERVGGTERVGAPWSLTAGRGDDRVAVRASGALAAGMELTQITLGEDKPYATEVRCPEAGLSTWFTAPGGDSLKELRLHLADVDASPATANVDFYATDGPAVIKETRGISVPPQGDTEVDLSELAESTDSVAVHVRTASGRVAASLFAERSGPGSDWVPPTAAPATTHAIPGVPGGGGDRRLIVAAPGDDAATVKVRLLTPKGEVKSDELKPLEVPPSAAATLSIDGPLGKQPGTVVVTSDRPVVAGVAMSRSGGDDTAYTAAVKPLRGPLDGRAVVPVLPGDTGTELLLGAPEKAVRVRVTPVAADGTEGEPKETPVKAGRTASVKYTPAKGTRALLVEVDDGAAPVYAARVLTHRPDGDDGGAATSVLPLPPAPTQIRLPAVSDSLNSVVR